MDGWDKWRVVCLAVLETEDIEDLYNFIATTTGMLFLGLGLFWMSLKLRKLISVLMELREKMTCIGADLTKTRDEIAMERGVASSPPGDED